MTSPTTARVEEFLEKPEPGQVDQRPDQRRRLRARARGARRAIADGRAGLVRARGVPGAGRRGPVRRCECEGYWLDIGTPERYLQATRDILDAATVRDRDGRAGWRRRQRRSRRRADRAVLVGRGREIEAGARSARTRRSATDCRIGDGRARRATRCCTTACTVGRRARSCATASSARARGSAPAPGVEDVLDRAARGHAVAGQRRRAAGDARSARSERARRLPARMPGLTRRADRQQSTARNQVDDVLAMPAAARGRALAGRVGRARAVAAARRTAWPRCSSAAWAAARSAATSRRRRSATA